MDSQSPLPAEDFQLLLEAIPSPLLMLRPDCARLPGMNGYELARELRALSGAEDAIFVAYTGYGQDEDRRRSDEAGFAHHLVKPAGIHELQRALADHGD
jgi:CheY-like chemotaxis protein